MLALYTITIGFCAYIAARGFLLIEAFINLRRLPVDGYKTPAFT